VSERAEFTSGRDEIASGRVVVGVSARRKLQHRRDHEAMLQAGDGPSLSLASGGIIEVADGRGRCMPVVDTLHMKLGVSAHDPQDARGAVDVVRVRGIPSAPDAVRGSVARVSAGLTRETIDARVLGIEKEVWPVLLEVLELGRDLRGHPGKLELRASAGADPQTDG